MSYFFYDKDIAYDVVEENKVKRKVKAHGGALMMVEVCFEDGACGDEHTHPHEQTTYCLEGEFEFTVVGETKVVKQGDTIFMPADSLHSCKLLSATGRLLDAFTPIRQDFL